MKTWQSMLLNFGLIFGAAFASKIPDQQTQLATLTAISALAAGAAKVNSETDQQGNKLPPPPK